MRRRGKPLAILPTWANRADPLFAYVGKRIKRPHVEAAGAPHTPSLRGAAPRHWTAGCRREGVEADSSDGALAGGLVLSGLPCAAPLGRPRRGQALTRRLRLRPGSVGRA